MASIPSVVQTVFSRNTTLPSSPSFPNPNCPSPSTPTSPSSPTPLHCRRLQRPHPPPQPLLPILHLQPPRRHLLPPPHPPSSLVALLSCRFPITPHFGFTVVSAFPITAQQFTFQIFSSATREWRPSAAVLTTSAPLIETSVVSSRIMAKWRTDELAVAIYDAIAGTAQIVPSPPRCSNRWQRVGRIMETRIRFMGRVCYII